MAALGILFLPPISDSLKEKSKIWQNQGLRYVSYIVLFSIAAVSMPKDLKALEAPDRALRQERSRTSKKAKFNFQTCNYVGGKFYIIPDMKAADVYINFQERGFKVNKDIKNEGTDIHCYLSTPDIKYNVIITGCTPNKIISVEAGVIDYSGNNLESVKAFIGFVATLQYKNSKPEEARKWVEENINIDGATTTIGGVTLSIHFKSKHSKSFSMEIKENKEEVMFKEGLSEKRVYYDGNANEIKK